jgi:hypothetical protein
MKIGFALDLERAAVDGDSYVTFICASTHEQWCWTLQTLVSSAMSRYASVEKVHEVAQGRVYVLEGDCLNLLDEIASCCSCFAHW